MMKMHERSDLQQHVNAFNGIIIDLVRLGVTIDEEDNAIILLCSLPSLINHLVATFTYRKDSIKQDDITTAL